MRGRGEVEEEGRGREKAERGEGRRWEREEGELKEESGRGGGRLGFHTATSKS